MEITLAAIAFDCDDALVVGRFWATLLDLPLDEGASSEFAAIGFAPDSPIRPAWSFFRVPEAKAAKNRCHVDLVVDDPEAAIARAVDAGAIRQGDFDEAGFRWTTLADPEGNEFDLVHAGH